MATTTVTIRLDTETKESFEKFCKTIGMPVSTAFAIFAKKTVRDNAIPFELKLDVPNATTVAAMREVDSGGGKAFETLEDLKRDLDAQD